MSRLVCWAEILEPGNQRRMIASGQEARALLALVAAGSRGVTALECSSWAFRLAAYCHALRKRYALSIRTERERHPGGWHGRHVLDSCVEILGTDGGDECRAT